ncbi:MAG TPA: PD-(D/E)XK nuclease family protein [Thermoanaerobaculia bacterium]|nr:PD-(D/E)XK nuclease family protein [Thermoanaerobaculia bacterium]
MPLPVRFGRYDDLARAIAERLHADAGADPLRPWAQEVLVASGGVARAITGELITRSGGFAGLQLRTLEAFARAVVNDAGEYPHVASEPERRLAMRAAAAAAGDSILEGRGVASMLERSYRDVRDGGVTLSEFERRARSCSLRHVERTDLLIRVWRHYEKFIRDLGATDPADLLRRAADLIRDGAAVRPQIVAGFYDMTGAQLSLLQALKDRGAVVEVFSPALGGEGYRFARPFLDTLTGSATVGGEHLLPVRTPRWSVRCAETRSGEVEATCRAVASLLRAGVTAENIGVTARSLAPADLEAFRSQAVRHGFAFSSTPPVPLAAHRIGRAVLLLLRLQHNGMPRAEVLEIVRSGFRTEAWIDVDRTDAETRRAQIAGGSSGALRLLSTRSAVVRGYIDVVAELERYVPAATARSGGAEWSGRLLEILSRFRAENETDVEVLDQLEQIALLFRRADATGVRFDRGAVIDAVENAPGIVHGPKDAVPVVWLGDVMKFRGRTFDHLFVTGAQEDVFPQRRVEDPLLPDSDRRALAVPEIGDGRDEEQLFFQLLTDGARGSLSFSFARTDGFGKMLRPSPLLKSFVIGHHPELRQDLLKDFGSAVMRLGGHPECAVRSEQCADVKTNEPVEMADPRFRRRLQLLIRAGTRSVFDGYISEPLLRERFGALLSAVSPTQLEDFGECPQKFLLRHILGVDDVDDPDRELQINHRDKGKIDHDILESFYRSLRIDELAAAADTLPLLPPEMASRLDAEIDRAFSGLEANAPPFNAAVRAMERRATKRNLQAFVAHDFDDLLTHGLFPSEFEYSFGAKYRDRGARVPEPYILPLGEQTLRVEGRIDRIDRGAGRLRIVDYKSGKAGRHRDLGKKIDKGVRLQLALYAMAVAEFERLDPATVSGTIKPLVINGSNQEKFAFQLAEKRDRLIETLRLFARAIAAGEFPAFPNEKDTDFHSCKYCPVKHACRTKHETGEKYAVMQFGDPRTLLERSS